VEDPLVLVTRLEELSSLASTDEPIKKAAIYAAVKAIQMEVSNSKIAHNVQVMEPLNTACFYINAAIGYEFVKKLSKEECLKKAQDKLNQLITQINIAYH